MNNLPDELLIEQLILLPVEQILKTCTVDQKFARICKNDTLWSLLTKRDFPEEIQYKPSLISWRNYYIDVYKSPFIPIYYFSTIIGVDRLTPYNLKKVDKRIRELVKEGYPIPENSTLVLIDSSMNPIAYFDGQKLIGDMAEVRKAVLVDPQEEISLLTVLSKLTRGEFIPDEGFSSPIYGYVDNNGEILIGTQWVRTFDEYTVTPCKSLTSQQIIHAVLALDELMDEAYELVPNLLLNPRRRLSLEIREQLCEIIVRALRTKGLILNE